MAAESVISCDNDPAMIEPGQENRTLREAVSWGGIDTRARLAGYLGLLPFAAAFVLAAFGGSQQMAEFGLRIALVWGAVILSFIAAVHWGLALAGRWPWSTSVVVVSTVPSVVGAAAVLVGGERGVALLVAGFGLFWLFEHRRLAESLPPDYLLLRRVLSVGVCVLLVLTAFAAAGEPR